MTRKRIGGELTATAMKALSALRRADIVDVIEPRPDRPCDRITDVREARRLLAAGASVSDIAYALDLTTAVVRTLIGPGKGPRAPEKRLKGPRNRIESSVLEVVADETDADHEQQDRA